MKEARDFLTESEVLYDVVKDLSSAGRLLNLWCASLIDRARAGDVEAQALVPLLTPILKAHLTDEAIRLTSDALQVFGGHGYIEEWGMSQIIRDTRVASIYEGTNGIQAIDLVSRKLPAKDGYAASLLSREMSSSAALLPKHLEAQITKCRVAFDTAVSQLKLAPQEQQLHAAGDVLALCGQALLGLAWAWSYSAPHSSDEKRRLAEIAIPLTAIETERRLARSRLCRNSQKQALA